MLNRVKIRKLNFNILLPDITHFNFSSTYNFFFILFIFFHRLDGGEEDTQYDNGYTNGSAATAATAVPSNPFTQQQYQAANSTNPFARK